MSSLYKVPLLLLFVGACMGLFLRYQLIAPTQAVNFTYVLHGHSHVMFLGWVFNVLYLAFVSQFTAGQRIFRILFWILQVSVAGMLVSFPLQGYGLYSIVFTTLHTFGAYVFIACFLFHTRTRSSLAITLARTALLLFVVSSFGPFYLGYLNATGLGHSNLYRFAIYFYLHFQYNGFFFFGVLTLLLQAVEPALTPAGRTRVRRGMYIAWGTSVLTYPLSILWASPGMGYNIVGFVAAVVQVLALLCFITPVKIFLSQLTDRSARLLVVLSAAALVFKCILQILSAHPALALFANEYRAVVIAYLHLVLLGCISFFLVGWLIYKDLLPAGIGRPVKAMIIGFIGSEIVLGIMPWSAAVFRVEPMLLHKGIFVLSIPLTIGMAGITYRGTIGTRRI
ncbi:hypothetical protein [Dawidia soli]|uniref:Uncharacterized protein n=1 Tax=Dawidia soli TaxID=2782352 RepID=A0AAP2GHD5_9BACT|nr:hypothetical protein [Dawidia soli]MBT1687096.1 hypothetical protein [Dawidia soli]